MDIGWNTQIVAGNEVWRVVSLFIVILAAMLAAKLGKAALLRSALVVESSGRLLAATALRAGARSVALVAVALALPVGAAFLVKGEVIQSIVGTIHGVLLSLAIGFTFYQLIDVAYVWLRNRTAATENKMDDMLVPIVRTSLRATVVVFTLLQMIQSLTDRPMASIIAGLGVGGLAIALAAQDTIKHFFGSLVLFADKPFQIGDRINVDAVDGVIEEVGFRSTRLRTLEGHLVTLPNGDLANKTIINIGQRPHIRHRFVLPIPFDTPPEKVRKAIEILKELLADHEGMKPDFPPRVVFNEFGSVSLNILVMFWYHPGDFWNYMFFTEKLNLRILEAFNREGIEFAFPTQTLFLAGDAKRPLNVTPTP